MDTNETAFIEDNLTDLNPADILGSTPAETAEQAISDTISASEQETISASAIEPQEPWQQEQDAAYAASYNEYKSAEAARKQTQEDTATAMRNVCLSGLDDEADKWLAAHPEYNDFHSTATMRDAGAQDFLIGNEIARDFANGDVFSVLFYQLEQETDPEKKAAFAEELNKCSSVDATRLLGRRFREAVQSQDRDKKSAEAQWQLDFDKAKELWSQQGGAVMRGTAAPSAELAVLSEKHPEIWERLNAKAPKARAALAIIMNRMHGGMSDEQYNAAIAQEVENVRAQEKRDASYYNDMNALAYGYGAVAPVTQRMSDADALQQARANLSQTIATNRQDYKLLADALSDENGNLDEAAVSAFGLMLEDAVVNEQTLDPKALRSFIGGLTAFVKESGDYFERQRSFGAPYESNVTGGYNPYIAGSRPSSYGNDMSAEERALYNDRRIEKMKDLLTPLEKERLDVSERSSMLAQAVGDISYTAGNSAIPTVAGMTAAALTGGSAVAAWAGAAAATYPGAANEAITSAYANGLNNPLLVGHIAGAPRAAWEGLFDIIPSGGAGRALTNAVARKAVALPVAGRMLESIQTNAMLRYMTGVAVETVGETLEDPGAEATNEAIFKGLNAIGVNIDSPEFNWATALRENLSPRQLLCVAGYSALLGVGGIPADRKKARDYAKDKNRLLAAGHSEPVAREMATFAKQTDETISDIYNDTSLTDEEKAVKIAAAEEKLDTALEAAYEKDVLNATSDELEKRFSKEQQDTAKQNMLALTAVTGARDIVLKRNGIIAEHPLANGNYLVTFETKDANGMPTETQKEMSSQALNGWLSLRQNADIAQDIREYQALLSGKQGAEKARIEQEKLGIKLINLATDAHPAFLEAFNAAVNGKQLDIGLLRKLAALQNEEIQRFIGEENITETEARQRESSFIPGVSAGTVANIANDIETRITQGEGTTDNQSKGAKLSDAQKVSAIRFNGLNGGSVIAFFENNISAADLAEDLWEARLRRAVSNGRATWQQLAQRLFRAQADMQRIDPSIRLFKKGITAENAAPQQIIEAYSSLQAADLLTNYAAMPLDASTKTLLGEVLASTRAMRAAALTARVWRQVKDTADVDLVSMLAEEGLAVADYFTPAMQQASAEMEELGARDFIPDPAPTVAETIEQAKAEQKENAENPKEPEGTPQPIPAEESVTGEPIPAESPLANAPYNPQTGKLSPRQGHPIRHGKKKGAAFADNAYQEETDGTLTGAVSVDNLRLADIPYLKETHADLDELSGDWNPLSAPIKGVQLADGTIVIYSGRMRLAHAKATGTPYILVNVKKASDIKSDLTKWMRVNDACDNLLNGTASAEQAALAWSEAKKQGISYERFNSMGLVMKDSSGETTATMKLGVSLVENATEKQLQEVLNGENLAEHLMHELEDALVQRLTETKQQKLERQTKSRAKWKVTDKKLSPEAQETLVLKETAKTAASKDYREVLLNVFRKVSNGVLDYVATDGMRLTLFSKKTSEKDSEQLLKKDGTKADTSSKYPLYKQVIPNDNLNTRATIQFNLQDVPSSPSSTSKNHRSYTLDFGTTSVQIDTRFLNDTINQVKALSQNMGASPIVTIGYSKVNQEGKSQPITITAQAGEWTYKSVIMPMQGNGATVRVPVGDAAQSTASISASDAEPSVTIGAKDICRTQEEAKQKVGRKGAPIRLENKTLGIEADFSKKSEWKIVYTDSKGRSLRNLAELGYDDETAQTIFWTAYGNIVNLFENATSKREEGVKQNKERGDRESFTHVYSDFAIEGIPDNLTADIVLKVPQKKKQTPTVYLLITDKKGKQQNTIDGVGKAPSSGVASAAGAIETENASSVNTESEDSASTASLTAENPDDILGGVKRARRSTLAERMMHHAQAEANRIRRTVKGKSNTKEAAEVMASVLIALETARKYVPTARIPRMTAKRAALEAYIAMMQEGRYGINRNGGTKRRGLTEAEIAATEERALQLYEAALQSEENLTAAPLNKQRQKELMRDFIRTAAREGIGVTAASIYDDIKNAIATELSRQLITSMDERLAAQQPTISASRRPIRAKVAPEAYKDFGTIRKYMAYTQDQMAAEETKYFSDRTAAEADLLKAAQEERAAIEKKIEELDKNYALLKTYGALANRSYDEVLMAAAALNIYINTERHFWEEKLQQKKDELAAIKADFYSKVGDEAGDANYHAKLEREANNLKNTIGSFFKQLQSPAQFFLALSGHHALGKLAERTMNGIANANAAIGVAERNRRHALVSAFAKARGIKPLNGNNYTDRQIEKLENGDFADFTQEILRVRNTGLTRTYTDPKNNKPVTRSIEMSDGQLMNLILMAEQPFYEKNALRWGYTPELLQTIKDQLGAEKVQFAYEMRRILQSDHLPAIFQQRTGVVMSEDQTYWPGHLDIARIAEGENAAIIGDYTKNGTYGMLKNRVDTTYDFSARDIMSVFNAACAQRNNYIYMQPITADWRSLMADTTFANNLKGALGPTNYKLLSGILDALDGAAIGEGFMHFSTNKAISRFMSGWARALLASSPTTIIRQLDAVLHGGLGENTNGAALAAQIIKDRQNRPESDPHMTYAKVMQLKAFQARHGGSTAYDDLMRAGDNATWSRFSGWMRAGMNAIEKTDLFCNAISACALYNLTYDKLQAQNKDSANPLTEKEIATICEQAVTNMLELTAQPLRRTQKSMFVLLNNNIMADAMAFLGSETINKVGFSSARFTKTYNETGSLTRAFGSFMKPLATMGIGGSLLGVIIAYLRGTTPGDDADKIDLLTYIGTELIIGGTGADLLNDIPLIGGLFNIRGEYHSGIPVPLYGEWQQARRIYRMATDNRDHSASEYYNAATKLTRELSRDTAFLAIIGGNRTRYMTHGAALLGSLTSAMNIAYPFSQGAAHRAHWTKALPDSWEGNITKSAPKHKKKKDKNKQDLLHAIFA